MHPVLQACTVSYPLLSTSENCTHAPLLMCCTLGIPFRACVDAVTRRAERGAVLHWNAYSRPRPPVVVAVASLPGMGVFAHRRWARKAGGCGAGRDHTLPSSRRRRRRREFGSRAVLLPCGAAGENGTLHGVLPPSASGLYIPCPHRLCFLVHILSCCTIPPPFLDNCIIVYSLFIAFAFASSLRDSLGLGLWSVWCSIAAATVLRR
ncbi:hypothetical protein BD413DRAFT_293088 [Trametes elegans]|nr:hypothetical protein BD413DRAFT_293088 [Trametes elegans]